MRSRGILGREVLTEICYVGGKILGERDHRDVMMVGDMENFRDVIT